MFTRIRREKVLDHFVRGQVYEYIRLNPGDHYNSIRHKLGLKNGTLAYHLRTLELQAFIKSRRDRLFKRFYPTDIPIPQTKGIQYSRLQLAIIDLIKKEPGIMQSDLMKKLNLKQQVASYNLNVLVRNGVIRCERIGRVAKYYHSERNDV